ncbi:MAG: hypothetical protein Q7S53_00590 [bacterium]|nr:hypothetical protein [bacterium]
MTQVKIFQGLGYEVEEKLNGWLDEEGAGIEITHVAQSASVSSLDGQIATTVFYEKKKDQKARKK